jgi:hypothetical protein
MVLALKQPEYTCINQTTSCTQTKETNVNEKGSVEKGTRLLKKGGNYVG